MKPSESKLVRAARPKVTRLALAALLATWSGLARAPGGPATAAPPGDVVKLDPFVVEEQKASNLLDEFFFRPTQWLYATIGSYEILSQGDSETTGKVAAHLADSLLLDEEFVPPSRLGRLAAPMGFIMFDRRPTMEMAALIPDSLTLVDSPRFGKGLGVTFAMGAGGIDVGDADTHYAVQNRGGMSWPYAAGGLGKGPVPTGILFETGRCRPALPRWYRFGLVGPCGLLRLASLKHGTVSVAAATWRSEPETERLLQDWKKKRLLPVLPPLAGLFQLGDAPRGGEQDWPEADWMAEAALFLRWGMYADGNTTEHRSAFENFLERSRSRRVSESMFADCFGFGFAEMQRRLSLYLVEGARNEVTVDIAPFRRWKPPRASEPPLIAATRRASPAEVARILGDWERLAARATRQTNPALSAAYRKRAGTTLEEGLRSGEADPRLLAVAGLYYFDLGPGRGGAPLFGTGNPHLGSATRGLRRTRSTRLRGLRAPIRGPGASPEGGRGGPGA